MSANPKSEKFFDKKFIWQLIIQGLFLGIIVSLSQKYFESWLGPPTALETLRIENNLNEKTEAYKDAMKLIIRKVQYLSFSQQVYIDTSFVNTKEMKQMEMDINFCYQKLCLYSDDPRIPEYFIGILVPEGTKFKHTNVFMSIQKFLGFIRNDLKNGNLKVDSTQFKFLLDRTTDSSGRPLPTFKSKSDIFRYSPK